MLDDDIGLLWLAEKIEPARRKKEARERDIPGRLARLYLDPPGYEQPPLIEAPAGLVALDFETDDPTLLDIGSAWAFDGVGDIIGMAVAWDGFEAYYPTGHREGNIERDHVINWLAHHFRREDIHWSCAKADYDIGWARKITGLYPAGGVEDVQHLAALLNEYRRSYSLENLAQDYLGEGKAISVIERACQETGFKYSEVMSHLKYLTGPAVAPYAAIDARRTYDLSGKLWPLIEAEELGEIARLESGLIPLSVEMRRKGVRVDLEGAERLNAELVDVRIPEFQEKIKRITGVDVEPWEAETIERALETQGIICKRTATGLPEVNQLFLTAHNSNPVAELILDLRKASKIQNTFLEGHILGHQVAGRIHPEFNQLKSEREDGGYAGTVSGRYSCTSPNLQQLPSRDPEWGPLIRGLFLPEEGELMASLDYSSQEPRLAVHYASIARVPNIPFAPRPLRGAAEAVAKYRNNPRTDYHQMVADMANIERKYAKSINLGLGYGMGGAKLARQLGLPTRWARIDRNPSGGRDVWTDISAEEAIAAKAAGASNVVELAGPEAAAIIEKWQKGAPFVKELYTLCADIASRRGFIKTILGRRCRFPLRGDGSYDWGHKALNRLCQGSAADQTKKAMLDLWRAGRAPLMTVHDELVFSVKDEKEAESIVPFMVDAITLEVPTIVDVKCGRTWGEIPK